MPTAKDVAQYILEKRGPTTTIKLQKLVYYCQAWALVWTDEPLFHEKIEAWANGPVAPELFFAHKGQFRIDPDFGIGASSALSEQDKTVVDSVLNFYGDKTSQWLVELTHLETPWNEARGGRPPGMRCDREISLSSMHDYYSGLLKNAQQQTS